MSNNWDTEKTPRSLTVTMIAFVAAFALHGVDHFRRGMTASPPAVMIGGTVQGVIVAIALVLVLHHHPWASRAAIIVGFGSAALFTYAHVLPTFLPSLQDSFSSGPRINVTWFSWLTAVGEIGTGLVLGYVGMQALRLAAGAPARGNPQIV